MTNEPSLTAEEKQARVIDLLKARSGIYHAALYETPTMRAENRHAAPIRRVRFGLITLGLQCAWDYL